jgi:hypothetical protein
VPDFGSARSEGWWAPGDDTGSNLVFKVEGGRAITRFPGAPVDLGIPIPRRFETETDATFILDIRNDDVIVVDRLNERGSGAPGIVGRTHLSIYDRKSGSWHDVVFDGGGASIRAFGRWLLVNEATVTMDISKGVAERKGDEKKSPGEAFRQRVLNPQDRPQDQITIDGIFSQSSFAFPGTIHLYDTRSKMKYTISTGQGDTEVLLIEGNVVYYRVNDSLFRARIGSAQIENVTQILKDDDVQLAHWAFLAP